MPKSHSGIVKNEKTGKWEINTNIVINGFRRRFHLRGFNTERDAYAAKVKIINDAKNSKNLYAEKSFDFSTLALAYYDYYSTTVKISTSANRRHCFEKYFVRPYINIPVKYVFSSNSLQSFKQKLIDTKFTTNWINEIIGYMKNIANFAYQKGYISFDEFNLCNFELVKVHDDKKVKKEKDIWSIDQFKLFLDTFDNADGEYAMFKLFGMLGCRIGELRGLQVKHLLADENMIRICQQVTSKIGGGNKIITLKTYDSNRTIAISQEMTKILQNHFAKYQLSGDDYMFPSRDLDKTNPISENTIRRIINKNSKNAGIHRITPHGLRHSNTTWLLSDVLALEDIKKVSKRLGHKNVSMTLNVYFHLHNSDSTAMINKLNF